MKIKEKPLKFSNKQDFSLTLRDIGGYNWKLEFYTDGEYKYVAERNGDELTNCKRSDEDDERENDFIIFFDNPHFNKGYLKCKYYFNTDDENYNDGEYNTINEKKLNVYITDELMGNVDSKEFLEWSEGTFDLWLTDECGWYQDYFVDFLILYHNRELKREKADEMCNDAFDGGEHKLLLKANITKNQIKEYIEGAKQWYHYYNCNEEFEDYFYLLATPHDKNLNHDDSYDGWEDDGYRYTAVMDWVDRDYMYLMDKYPSINLDADEFDSGWSEVEDYGSPVVILGTNLTEKEAYDIRQDVGKHFINNISNEEYNLGGFISAQKEFTEILQYSNREQHVEVSFNTSFMEEQFGIDAVTRYAFMIRNIPHITNMPLSTIKELFNSKEPKDIEVINIPYTGNPRVVKTSIDGRNINFYEDADLSQDNMWYYIVGMKERMNNVDTTSNITKLIRELAHKWIHLKFYEMDGNEKYYYADSDELWQYDEVTLLPSKSAELGHLGSNYYISYLNNEGNDVQKLIWEESVDSGTKLFWKGGLLCSTSTYNLYYLYMKMAEDYIEHYDEKVDARFDDLFNMKIYCYNNSERKHKLTYSPDLKNWRISIYLNNAAYKEQQATIIAGDDEELKTKLMAANYVTTFVGTPIEVNYKLLEYNNSIPSGRNNVMVRIEYKSNYDSYNSSKWKQIQQTDLYSTFKNKKSIGFKSYR